MGSGLPEQDEANGLDSSPSDIIIHITHLNRQKKGSQLNGTWFNPKNAHPLLLRVKEICSTIKLSNKFS